MIDLRDQLRERARRARGRQALRRPPQRRYTREQIDGALALVAEGKTLREAGEAIGARSERVSEWVKRAGLQPERTQRPALHAPSRSTRRSRSSTTARRCAKAGAAVGARELNRAALAAEGGMTTRPDTLAEPSPELLDELARRVGRSDFARFEAQLRSSGYCAHPVRLQGHVDVQDAGGRRRVLSTDREPDGVLRKACGNRRAAVCPPCAETYRWDAYHLLIAGLCGGKGVPESVAEHPMVFVTLTAPSFGLVHSRRPGPDGQAAALSARRDAPVCEHGVRMSCGERHDEHDPCLGEPLCPDCYDHRGAVIWNNSARGAVALHDDLPAPPHRPPRRPHPGRSGAARRARIREGRRVPQARPRAPARARPPGPRDARVPARQLRPPDGAVHRRLLERAVRSAVGEVHAKGSKYLGSPRVEWGDELDVRPLSDRGRSAREAAGYLAKYATKSTEQAGGLLHRVKASEVETVRVRPHVRAHLQAAFELHAQAEPQADAMRRAHAAAATAEARRYPPAADDRHPDELAHRARQALAPRRTRPHPHPRRTPAAPRPDHRVRRRRAARRDRVELVLHTGERIHLADVALIAHATPKLRDRHDPRLAACAHQFGHRGHCLTKSRRYAPHSPSYAKPATTTPPATRPRKRKRGRRRRAARARRRTSRAR